MRIAVTPGEPAGIGPELLVRYAQLSAQQRGLATLPELIAIASSALLRDTAEALGFDIELIPFENNNTSTIKAGQLSVVDIPTHNTVKPGRLDVENAAYVLKTLKAASQGCLNGRFDALVTGPVQKSIINEAGFAFSGHTEFFAQQSATPRVVMMLATQGLRVCLATTHLPLKSVSEAITQSSLTEIITIIHQDLQKKFGLKSPTILVCGLNPHAGESGHLGYEEIDTIIPVIETCQADGMNVTGPYPADTVFTPRYMEQADTILAMYHDQGLPVLKHKGFSQAVNITLGLPFIRTSVDHGTALDLAGQGQADLGSFSYAVQCAIAMLSAKSA